MSQIPPFGLGDLGTRLWGDLAALRHTTSRSVVRKCSQYRRFTANSRKRPSKHGAHWCRVGREVSR